MKKLPILLTALMAFTNVTPVFAAKQEIKTIAGRTRVETSYEASKYLDSPDYVFVNGYNFSDALSAYNIVKKYNAKLLLISKVTDIQNLNIKGRISYIVGGENVISKDIENELTQRFEVVKRISGQDRYETNLETLNVSGFSEVGIANGQNFADALAASGYLNKHNLGLGLTKTNQQFNKEGIKVKVTFGGKNSIRYGLGKRIAGRDRYETALAINKEINPNTLAIADGRDFPDALSALNLVIGQNAGVMLTDNKPYIGNMKIFAQNFNQIYLIGGIENPLNEVQNKSNTSVKPNTTLKPNKKYTNVEIMNMADKVVKGEPITKAEIYQIYNNKTIKRMLAEMGFLVYEDSIKIDTRDSVNLNELPYNPSEVKRQHDFVLSFIQTAGVDSTMDREKIINKLGIRANFGEKGTTYDDRLRYHSNIKSPYIFSNNGGGNCESFTMFLNQIMHELKIPSVAYIGYTHRGYHEVALVNVNGEIRQVSLQSVSGFEDNKDTKTPVYTTPDGWNWRPINDGQITKPDHPLSYYTPQLEELEQIYSEMR